MPISEQALDAYMKTDEARVIVSSMKLFDTPEEMLRAALQHRWQVVEPSDASCTADCETVTLTISREEAGKLKSVLGFAMSLDRLNIGKQSLWMQLDDLGVYSNIDTLHALEAGGKVRL